MTVSLSPEVLRDKVLGCWMGKNSGGTLGAPLEKAFGEPEPFDVWWYPKLEEGGIPNDDLELQLIWLLALEEAGPGLKAADLAQYWLDYVGYNFDEYGLQKTNLRLGLQPPVSGISNNWFKDCMGCPIRSEIWACTAPGFPRLAVQYAYEDAILDHAGGEGLYGELFNTAIQASAFVVSDPLTLIEIGLSYVPDHSQTHTAVQAALTAHAAGDDWLQARRRVLKAVPHYNTQHAPINMGFQVIGWLYGSDYGDALCKAVNCGYDTDCTGATLGSHLGIVHGHKGLPPKWLEPLGTVIATNASWGGLRNLDRGPRFIPTDIIDLTDRTLAVGRTLLAHHGLSLDAIRADVESLKADEASRAIWSRPPWRINHALRSLNVGIEYPGNATISHGGEQHFISHVENPHPCTIKVQLSLSGGETFTIEEAERTVELKPRSGTSLTWKFQARGPLQPGNRLDLSLAAGSRPALPTLPVVFVAATRWRLIENFPPGSGTDRGQFDAVYEPELLSGPATSATARKGKWITADAGDNALPFTQPLTGAGVTYAQTFSWSPGPRKVRVGIPSNTPLKFWLNGKLASEMFVYRPYRPNYAGVYDGMDEAYVVAEFQEGWNELFIKFVRGDQPLKPNTGTTPMEAGLVLCDPGDCLAGLIDQVRSRLPWE